MARGSEWVKLIGAVVAAGFLFAIAKHPAEKAQAPARPAPALSAPVFAPAVMRAPIVRPNVVAPVRSHPIAFVTQRRPIFATGVVRGSVKTPPHGIRPPVLHVGFGGTPITRYRFL